jgi:two-component system chemotaxis sensor kinase CheA
MNTTELLDQFINESREGLEQIGRRLLEVEREPGNRELLNDLFRQVHTLKGNCGLFEFKALERVVHAGEDLLDRVRNGSLDYSGAIADALLEAMDYTSELVDAIASSGHLPAGADERAQVLAAALRQHLPGAPEAAAALSPPTADTPSDWVRALPAGLQQAGHHGMRYRPEPECFFKGEDPWHLALSMPGLLHVAVAALEPWPAAEVFDCYRCNLELVLVSDAPVASLREHFRYVPEQVEFCALAAPKAQLTGDSAMLGPLRQRTAELWDLQRALLTSPGLNEGTLAATRTAFMRLLACWPDRDAAEAALAALAAMPPDAGALAQWAALHRPHGPAQVEGLAEAAVANAPASPAPPIPATLEPRRGAAPAAPAAPMEDVAGNQKVLKVGQDKIDRLMELIGEMVVAKNALPYLAQRAEDVFGQRELSREIKNQYAVINRIAEDMQHAIMQVRMLPVGTVFQRFGRLVRDISKKLGKDVQLVIEGEDTEADKNVIESLADPLIHILRNSLDHGIELPAVRLAAGKPARGTLRVAARQEGDRVVLDISDDGAGVDTARVRAKAVERGLIPADRAAAMSEHEAVQLVFLPGFSTADTISDLSGRGVGMDVVRTAVARINGTVNLSSVRGQGTRLQLALPLSMAVTNVMMIETDGRRFGVPMDLIVETVRVPAEDIHRFKNAQTTVLRGRIVPLRPLNELLALETGARLNADGEHAVLVVRHGHETVGLLVDDFHGTSDIILKPLEGVLGGLTGFAGTALMGDGSVLMILNPKELL